MALTSEEQKLYDFAKGALPAWVKRQDEFLTAAAKMFGSVRTMTDYLFGQALITTATGPGAGTPDWLNQHARDRGTSRQAGEGDLPLQQRLRVVPDALTRQALLDAANAILAAAGVVGTAALLELPRDGAWAGTYQAMTGVGGTIAQIGTTSKFQPVTLPWAVPPYTAPSVAPGQTWQLTLSSAANAGNNGTRVITGLDGNQAVYTNAAGVGGVDAGIVWTAKRRDVVGNVTDGFARAFAGRGYRATTQRPFKILMILPFGTSAGTAASVLASLRGKKAAGFGVIVERRLNP